jgi:AraC family transcriptional regulator of adaptative response / DNA-3-methyladenine glycosylase II
VQFSVAVLSRKKLAVHLDLPSYEGLTQIVERVRRVFDLSADPIQIADQLAKDPRLRMLVEYSPGLRAPGVWDGFESAFLALLGQTLSTSGAKAQAFAPIKHF